MKTSRFSSYSLPFVKTEDFGKRLPLFLQPLNIFYEMDLLTYVLDHPYRNRFYSESVCPHNECTHCNFLLYRTLERGCWSRMLRLWADLQQEGAEVLFSFLKFFKKKKERKKITNESLLFFFKYMCIVTMYIRRVWILGGFVCCQRLPAVFIFKINVPFLVLDSLCSLLILFLMF